MGVSTNGQICFGISFEEGFEFPWDSDEVGDGDIEDWWIFRVKGFTHSKECYGEDGEQLPGITDADVDAYFQERRDFAKANPLPVELVNYCSDDCPMYVLAVPATVRTARRGYPHAFDPATLMVSDDERAALLAFCTEHGIAMSSQPQWLLTSLWN